MGKATRAAAQPKVTGIDATPERLAKNDHDITDALRSNHRERMTKVRRVKPPIDTLRMAGKLTEDQHAALAHYAQQCWMARKSPIKDSLNQERGTGGHGLSAAVVSAILAEARIDHDLGSLRDIAHAIAVEETTLTAWCVRQHGGRERYDGRGRFIDIVPYREVQVMKIALQDLRMAADRIVR